MKSKIVLTCTILFIVFLTSIVYATDLNTQVVTVEIPNMEENNKPEENGKDVVVSHEHTWKEDTEKSKKATCTENGYKYFICSECKETKKEEIKASGHKFSEWKTVNGLKERKCEICGFIEKEKADENKVTPTQTVSPTPNSENKIILHNTNIQNVEAYNILENGILKPSGADKTVANKIIPAAGKKVIILPVLITLLIIYTSYVQYKKYKKL